MQKNHLKSQKNNILKIILPPLLVFVLFFASWELIIKIFDIQKWILPTLTNIFLTFINEFSNEILPHALITLRGLISGFLIGVPLGVLIGAFISQFKILDKAFSPFIILLVTTPLISLVPLLMMWLGFGIEVKIIAVTIQTFPIVMMNSVTGFSNVDKLKLELMKSLGANRVQTFFNVTLPASLENVFTGAKLGGIFATIAAISTEFVGGNVGLGSQIVYYTSNIQNDKSFAFILAVALIGTSLYNIISFIESKIIRWEL